jgi:cytochrome P450
MKDLSYDDRPRHLDSLPLVDLTTEQARSIGFLGAVQSAVRRYGADLRLAQQDGSVKVLLGRAEYGDAWRRNSRRLIKDVDTHPAPASLARLILDNNLTTAREGAEWEAMRATVAPLMRFKKQSYATALNEAAAALADGLAKGEQSLWSLCGAWSAHSVCQPVLGVGFTDAFVLDLVNALRQCMFHLLRQADAVPLSGLVSDALLLRLRATLRDVVIDAVRQYQPGDDTMVAVLLDQEGHVPGHMPDAALIAKLQPVLIGALAAAVHNNSLAMFWTLSRIARHADVADAIATEASGFAADSDVLLTARPRALAAIREALRLMPVLPFIERRAAEDVVMAGLAIPAGTTVIFSPWIVHRDAASWPDPLRYDPARFADEARVDLTRWFPFGLGHRACIGSNLALNQLVVSVSHIVMRLHLTMPQSVRALHWLPTWRVLLEPREDGGMLHASPRETQLSPVSNPEGALA